MQQHQQLLLALLLLVGGGWAANPSQVRYKQFSAADFISRAAHTRAGQQRVRLPVMLQQVGHRPTHAEQVIKTKRQLLLTQPLLSPLASDPAGELDVLGHDGDSLGVDRTEVGILEEPSEIGL